MFFVGPEMGQPWPQLAGVALFVICRIFLVSKCIQVERVRINSFFIRLNRNTNYCEPALQPTYTFGTRTSYMTISMTFNFNRNTSQTTEHASPGM